MVTMSRKEVESFPKADFHYFTIFVLFSLFHYSLLNDCHTYSTYPWVSIQLSFKSNDACFCGDPAEDPVLPSINPCYG